MNLTGISQELNFSEEVLSNANALTELRKDGLVKLNSIHQKIKKLNNKKYNQQFEDYKKEILEAKKNQTAIQKQDDEIRIPTLKKLRQEYKALHKIVKEEVSNLISKTKQKYVNQMTDVENEYKEQLNALEIEKNTLDFSKKEDKAIYKEKLNGINIKRKRALKTLTRDRLQAEIDCKKAILDLRNAYIELDRTIRGKNNLLLDLGTQQMEAMCSTSFEKTVKDRNFWLSKISLFCFLALVLIYFIVCAIGGIKIEYQKILEGSSIIIAVALGGVFIYSMRSFDMSLGGGTALAACLGAMIWNQTHNIFLVLVVGIVVGVVVELINSTLASLLKLPVMVTTLAMSSVLSAILTNILENTATQTVKVTGIKDLDTFWFYFLVIIALFLVTAFIFKSTPVGRRNKMIGANSTSSRYSGVNITKQGLITFFIAGICVGVGGMLYIVRSRTISMSSCSTIGLDVILAIVFGGMQTTGGPKSKISAAILGGLTASLISYLLIAIGRVSGFSEITNYESFVKGVLFLGIVSVNTIGNRTNRLPAIEMLW